MTENSALKASTSSSSTEPSTSNDGNPLKTGKSPFVRRVPPPRVSMLPPASLAGSNNDLSAVASLHERAASSASLNTYVANKPLVNQGAMQLLAESSGSGPSYGQAQAMLVASPTASQHALSVASSSSTAAYPSTSVVRPAAMTRTASGGAKIAALASRFGSTAAQKVAAAKQQVQQSASAALASASSSGRSTSPGVSTAGNDNTGSFKAIAGGLRDKGTSLVAGAAAKVRSTSNKGKERYLAPSGQAGDAASSPLPGSGNASPRLSPNPQHSASVKAMGRRPSLSSTVILGVRIPTNRAGEVFGAPLRVAADRTKLEKIEDLPASCSISHAAAERRKEACRYLPAIAIRCLDYLNEYGKTEEGLYRVPGSSQQVANLRAIFDSGSDVDLLATLSTREVEPSAVASLFKLWMRELPESLLHQLEREIDLLLMEHTGNAASSKVTMAQAQSVGSIAQPAASGASQTSPIVIERIRTLFSQALPVENLVLLREISYHLAHLSNFSAVTKMTFSNLRLILSPTLRLSPVMLSVLVNERESVFPKPGQLGHARLESSTSGLSIDFTRNEPKLKLSIPGIDDLPPLPAKQSSQAPSLPPRAPYSSLDSSWSAMSGGSVGGKKSSGSLNSYRASWHVVDLPQPRKSETDDDEAPQVTGTPIARKFLHQRTASASNLLDRAGSTSPASIAGSTKPANSSPLQRTPTFGGFSGRSSPFFSSGNSPMGGSGHARKRSSVSSIGSLQTSLHDTTAEWRTRRLSSMRTQAPTITTVSAAKSALQDEEEELSSSDTSTSLSSVDSAATPTDAHDIQVAKKEDNEEEDFASRRRTVTAESFGRDEIKRKRGSMMLMNLPAEMLHGDFTREEEAAILSSDARHYNRSS